MIKRGLILLTGAVVFGGTALADEAQWYSWRGPHQNGTSDEKYSDWSFDEKPAWTHKLQGRGNPVVADGRLYSFGYHGEGADFSETLTALDAKTGKLLWEVEQNDYVSDTAYSRYAIGSPTVDVETGNIYLATTNGHFFACDRDGKVLWEHSMIERFGRLTFPNGRSGCVVIEGNTAIVRCISSYWGKEGPARDRFYAFDKITGEPVWSSEAGIAPQDSSFSTPIFEVRDGRRVFYAGTGCGNIICVNASNGVPIWRWQVSKVGVNASPVLYKGTLIAIHGGENIDTTETGRMFAIKLPEDLDNTGAVPDEVEGGAPVLPASVEVWRNRLSMFTGSPTLVGNRVYQLVATGELVCVNADDGSVLWSEKLGPDSLHSSPLAVDGKLIVPINEGVVYLIEPTDEGAKILHTIKLEGNCIGSPTVWNGHLYIHTTEQLYCWKFGTGEIETKAWPKPEMPPVGKPVGLLAIPNDVTMAPGETQAFRLFSTDANGFVTGTVDKAAWKSFIPPTARVKSEMDAAFNEAGELVTKADAKVSAGAFMGVAGEVKGTMRGRALPTVPYTEDFEGYELSEDHATDAVKFAYPPLPWIGARFKWEIREVDGTKAMAKTLDRILFQRAITYIGHQDQSGYVLQADVMTDGNRRVKSDVGVINQRYAIVLKGNANLIEISSNFERIQVSEPFAVSAGVWYTLKTQVDVQDDGSGIVRAKVWAREQPEPDAWTIEFTHKRANTSGSPGLFGFSPQSQKSVYIDNLSITPNPESKQAMNNYGKFLTISAAAILGGGGIAPAEDWPMWGGSPSRNMVSGDKNLPLDFLAGKKIKGTETIDPATTKDTKWVFKAGSSTYGTPTVSGGKVLIGTNNESPRDSKHVGDRGIIMCVDEETGEFLWQLVIPKLGAGKVSDWEYLGVCSSADIVGDRAYFVSNRCEVVCIDMNGLADGNDGPYKDEAKYMAEEGKPPVEPGPKDGDIIWVYDMREELGVFPHNVASSSVLLHGGKLWVTTSNGVDWSHTNLPAPQAPTLIALDPETGQLVGEEVEGIGNRTLHCNWASPAAAEIDGKPVVIFGAGDGFCYAFSTETKKDEEGYDVLQKIWSVDCNPPEYRKDMNGKPIKYATFDGPSEIISTPVVHEGKAYVAIGQDPEHGEGVGMLSCIDVATGKVDWVNKSIERTISTPSVADGIVYIADYRGRVHALETSTGKTIWVFDTKSHIWSSTLVADGKVYIPNEDGEVIILAVGREMKELGRVEFSAPIYGAPVAANGVLYIGSQTHVHAFKTGAKPKAE